MLGLRVDGNTRIPQGCVLSPLLFIVFINDIFHIPLLKHIHVQVLLFADDIAVVPSHPSSPPSFLMLDLHLALVEIGAWADRWLIRFSSSKSAWMWFTRLRHIVNVCVITLSGTVLNEVQSYKYLGIFLERTGSFTQHAAQVLRKTKAACYCVSRLLSNSYSPSPLLIRNLIVTIIVPCLMYGLIFWQPTQRCVQQLNKLLLQPLYLFGQLPSTTHIPSVCVEFNLPLVPLLRELDLTRFFRRVLNLPFTHPSRQILTLQQQRAHNVPLTHPLSLHPSIQHLAIDINNTTPTIHWSSLYARYLLFQQQLHSLPSTNRIITQQHRHHTQHNDNSNSNMIHSAGNSYNSSRSSNNNINTNIRTGSQNMNVVFNNDMNTVSRVPSSALNRVCRHLIVHAMATEPVGSGLRRAVTNCIYFNNYELPAYLRVDDTDIARVRCRLRLNRARTNSYFCHFIPGTDSDCSHCGAGVEDTVMHVLLQCPLHADSRRQCRAALGAHGLALTPTLVLGFVDSLLFSSRTQRALLQCTAAFLRQIIVDRRL